MSHNISNFLFLVRLLYGESGTCPGQLISDLGSGSTGDLYQHPHSDLFMEGRREEVNETVDLAVHGWLTLLGRQPLR